MSKIQSILNSHSFTTLKASQRSDVRKASSTFETSPQYKDDYLAFENINMALIDCIYDREKSKNTKLLSQILAFNSHSVDFLAEKERAFPQEFEL